MKTRRRFIGESLLAGGVLSFSTGCASLFSQPSRLGSGPLQALRSRFQGQLLFPDDAGYESARTVFYRNTITDLRPALVAQCAGTDDVVRCLDLAARENLPVAVQGGRHSLMGWGTCDDGIVIDLSRMKTLSVDAANRIATAEAGVIGEELVAAAGPDGLTPILGQCPAVGAAGLTLGGGLGWLSGKHGAACDNLVSAEVVTAAGRTIFADASRKITRGWSESRIDMIPETCSAGITTSRQPCDSSLLAESGSSHGTESALRG